MAATTATTAQKPTQRKGNGTKILASLAVLALAGGIFTFASLALFTDQEIEAANDFSTGSIDLVTTAPGLVVITMTDMAPGDEVTGPLNVANAGTLEFRYSLESVTTENVLAAELDLTIREGVTTCDDANWDADGTVVYATGDLGANPGPLAIFGDPAQTPGGDPGDRVLAAGANEDLCFNVTLPLAATNASQGLATTATFTFDAEQTANN